MRRIFTLPPVRGYRVQVKAMPGTRDGLFQVPGCGIFDTRPTPPPQPNYRPWRGTEHRVTNRRLLLQVINRRTDKQSLEPGVVSSRACHLPCPRGINANSGWRNNVAVQGSITNVSTQIVQRDSSEVLISLFPTKRQHRASSTYSTRETLLNPLEGQIAHPFRPLPGLDQPYFYFTRPRLLMRGEPAVRLDSPILEMCDELYWGPPWAILASPPPFFLSF